MCDYCHIANPDSRLGFPSQTAVAGGQQGQSIRSLDLSLSSVASLAFLTVSWSTEWAVFDVAVWFIGGWVREREGKRVWYEGW